MATKQKKEKGGKAPSKPDVSGKLAKLKGAWQEAADNPIGDFTNWEPGKYQAQLVSAELGESAAGRLQVKWGFGNLEDSEASPQFMFDGLDTEKSPQCLAYLRKHIEQMGYEAPNDLSKLEPLLEQMVADGPKVTITVKQNGEYINTYINNLIEE
mgnify:CR=1 FL=1